MAFTWTQGFSKATQAILSNEISWRFHRTYRINRKYNIICKSHYRSPLKLLRSNQNQRRFLNRALNTFLRNPCYPAFCFWGNPFACQTPLAAAQWNWVGRVAQKETVNWMISPHEKNIKSKILWFWVPGLYVRCWFEPPSARRTAGDPNPSNTLSILIPKCPADFSSRLNC